MDGPVSDVHHCVRFPQIEDETMTGAFWSRFIGCFYTNPAKTWPISDESRSQFGAEIWRHFIESTCPGRVRAKPSLLSHEFLRFFEPCCRRSDQDASTFRTIWLSCHHWATVSKHRGQILPANQWSTPNLDQIDEMPIDRLSISRLLALTSRKAYLIPRQVLPFPSLLCLKYHFATKLAVMREKLTSLWMVREHILRLLDKSSSGTNPPHVTFAIDEFAFQSFYDMSHLRSKGTGLTYSNAFAFMCLP